MESLLSCPSSPPRSNLSACQLMNGHIWMESNGRGKGATCKFLAMLKLDAEGSDDSDKDQDEGPDVNFFSLRIMVVDDNMIMVVDDNMIMVVDDNMIMVVDDNMVNRLVTKRLLDRIGISTRVVESGRECLRILAEEQDEEKYDVLLLDLMMPEVGGEEECGGRREREWRGKRRNRRWRKEEEGEEKTGAIASKRGEEEESEWMVTQWPTRFNALSSPFHFSSFLSLPPPASLPLPLFTPHPPPLPPTPPPDGWVHGGQQDLHRAQGRVSANDCCADA
ncbi:unnamed protein product [Closterium sp. Naga37s-1]|nr:unnamed protein product [Closterium sp. Naga37s-1]